MNIVIPLNTYQVFVKADNCTAGVTNKYTFTIPDNCSMLSINCVGGGGGGGGGGASLSGTAGGGGSGGGSGGLSNLLIPTCLLPKPSVLSQGSSGPGCTVQVEGDPASNHGAAGTHATVSMSYVYESSTIKQLETCS